MTQQPTMVIADDHELLRSAIVEHMAPALGLKVVASVGTADDAVGACRIHRPDLLLLDIEMPGRDALSAVLDIRAVSPNTRVIVLSAYNRDIILELALRSGVVGYLLKSDSPEAITAALRKALAGERVFSSSIRSRMVAQPADGVHHARFSRLLALTPREVEVLKYIGQGMDNSRIAATMHLSKRTVERHVARVMDALDIRDRSALTRFAFEEGLLA